MSRVRCDAGQSRPAEPRILDAGDADCGEAGHSEIADAGSALGARLSGGRRFWAGQDSRSGWGRLAGGGPGWEEGWVDKHEAPRECHGAWTAGCFSLALAYGSYASLDAGTKTWLWMAQLAARAVFED